MKKNYLHSFIFILFISISFFRFGDGGIFSKKPPTTTQSQISGEVQKIQDSTDYASYTSKSSDELSTDVEDLTVKIETDGIQVYNAEQLKQKVRSSKDTLAQYTSEDLFAALESLHAYETEKVLTSGTTSTSTSTKTVSGTGSTTVSGTGSTTVSGTGSKTVSGTGSTNPQVGGTNTKVPGTNVPPAGKQNPQQQNEAEGDDDAQQATIPGAVLNIIDTVSPILPQKAQGVIGTVKNIWENVGPVARQFFAASMSLAGVLGAPESATNIMGNVGSLIFGLDSPDNSPVASTGKAVLRGFSGFSQKTKTLVGGIRAKFASKFGSKTKSGIVDKTDKSAGTASGTASTQQNPSGTGTASTQQNPSGTGTGTVSTQVKTVAAYAIQNS